MVFKRRRRGRARVQTPCPTLPPFPKGPRIFFSLLRRIGHRFTVRMAAGTASTVRLAGLSWAGWAQVLSSGCWGCLCWLFPTRTSLCSEPWGRSPQLLCVRGYAALPPPPPTSPRRGDGGRVAARESFFSTISIPRHVKRRKTQRTTRIETCQFED